MQLVKRALNASGYVGLWETNLQTQVVELTGRLPALLGIEADRAAVGVPVSKFLDGVHPEDRERIADRVHEAHRSAGRFEAEFRTFNNEGRTHWVSARGQVETDLEGHGLRCLGVVLDISDTRQAGPWDEDRTLQLQDKLADALLAVRPLAEKLDSPILKMLLDTMLFEVGKLIAKHDSLGRFDRKH